MTFDSEALFTKVWIFQGYSELMQILGFFVYSHGNNSILYLNMFSDCARSVHDKHPVRIDHLGRTNSLSLKNALSFLLSIQIRSTRSVNLEFYDALLRAYGAEGIECYLNRLQSKKKN